jgi:hypothetical protein
MRVACKIFPNFPEYFPVPIDPDKRAIGRDIKKYLAINRISREEFSFQTKLGKSTIDKLITGIFSEATLQIVLDRTSYVRNNSFAAKQFGAYSRAAWTGYLRTYRLLLPSIAQEGHVEALCVSIEWDEAVPGMVMVQRTGRKLAKAERVGILTIPHERSPLIYIQAVEGQGRTFVLSTMLGEPVMRGLMMTVSNLVANSYIPIAVPVDLRRLPEGAPDPDQFGHISPDDVRFKTAIADLRKVVARQYAKLINP